MEVELEKRRRWAQLSPAANSISSPTQITGPNPTWTPAQRFLLAKHSTHLFLLRFHLFPHSVSSSSSPSFPQPPRSLASSKTLPRIADTPARKSQRGDCALRPWVTASTPSPSPPSGSCSPPYVSRLLVPSIEIGGDFVSLRWFDLTFFRLISLQPVGKACADRARAHGCRIRADLARDQRFDSRSNPLSPL